MAPKSQLIGIFGGTFDPVHFGHLRCALEMRALLGLDQVLMVPASVPPHRESPSVGAEERLQMVELAIMGESSLQVDDRELRRGGPSYMVDTLRSLQHEYGDEANLVLLLGSDAFAGLTKWHLWEQIPQLAHVGVMARPGWQQGEGDDWVDGDRATWSQDPLALREQESGVVIRSEVSQLEISATQIRELCLRGGSARFLLPDLVWDYIETNRLYR